MAGLTAKISEKPYQWGFLTSTMRFPAMISGWGTGKTMCAILKGLINSHAFKSNLGLIVRSKFTDLRDSTLKDFELYTGIKVPQHTKEIIVPGTDSVIMFRHGEELSGLQNINLGWVYIEQAEEFDTDDQFQMLRGRLRRELIPNEKVWDNPYIKIGNKYKPFIERLQAERMQQAFLIANASGHNWCWLYWVSERPHKLSDDILAEMAAETGISLERLRKLEAADQYECFQANTFENKNNLSAHFIADIAKMKVESPKKYKRLVMNSHEDYDIEGAYYAALMSDALKDNRVGLTTLYEPAAPVYTFWDLGIRASDTTSIWFVQFVGTEIWLVDYYENYGEGIDHYSAYLNQAGYSYGAHYLPHDAKQRIQGRQIETRQQILQDLRPNESIMLLEPSSPIDRIELVRGLLPRCRFNEKCRVGVEALNHYTAKRNEVLSTENKPVFTGEPLHDWASNAADAFGYMAYGYRYSVIGGLRLGYPGSKPTIRDPADEGVVDLLEV